MFYVFWRTFLICSILKKTEVLYGCIRRLRRIIRNIVYVNIHNIQYYGYGIQLG
jgi:hypothetical protein